MTNLSAMQQQVDEVRLDTVKQIAAMQEQLKKLTSKINWINEVVKPKLDTQIENEFNQYRDLLNNKPRKQKAKFLDHKEFLSK